MTNLYKRFLTFGVAALAVCCTATGAFAAKTSNFDLGNYMLKPRHHSSIFDSERSQLVQEANNVLEGKRQQHSMVRMQPRQAAEFKNTYIPAYEYTDLDFYGDLDGPDGQLWYYTAKFDYERVEHISETENWVDMIMHGYTFEVYDGQMKHLGTIKDEITYSENEVRAVSVDLAPIVTRNYFNQDDKYELAVGLIINTTYYVNQYRTMIYSLSGEKKDGNDVPVGRLNQLIGDVLDASTPTEENFLMTFLSEYNDYEPEDEDDGIDNLERNYWAKYLANKIEVNVYAKAQPGKKELTHIFKRVIPLSQLPGDQQDAPFMLSYIKDGKAMCLVSYYEQPFYNRYDSFLEDTTQREGNNLIVELYQENDDLSGYTLMQTTTIPIAKNEEQDGVIASYFSVGSFLYRGDINYTDFNSGDKAAFYVTRQDYMASTDSYIPSVYVYNPDGTKRATVFEYADAFIPLADIPGYDPQELFISIDPFTGNYLFNFVNIVKCTTDFAITNELEVEDSDPELLTSNLNRVAVGDSYMYACELRVPSIDEDENDIMRAVWLDSKGKYHHIDEMNMGTNVKYAQLYISSEALNPTFYHSDAEQEYMILVKRATSSEAADEELMITQTLSAKNPKGKTLLWLKPTEELGELRTIIPYITEQGNKLMITYLHNVGDRSYYNQHYYNLPLDAETSGITDAIATPDNAIAYDGHNLVLEGEYIEVYNAQGMKMAAAMDSVCIDGLQKGIYFVRAGVHTAKIAIN